MKVGFYTCVSYQDCQFCHSAPQEDPGSQQQQQQQQLLPERRDSARAQSTSEEPKSLAAEGGIAWPGFAPPPERTGVMSVRRFTAPATARQPTPATGGASEGALSDAAGQHPIFVPETSHWESKAETALLQGIWQRWTGGRGGAATADPAAPGASSPPAAMLRAQQPKADQPEECSAQDVAVPEEGAATAKQEAPLMRTRASYENIAKFAYEVEGRQPSALVRPKSTAQREAAACGAAATSIAASRASSRTSSLASSSGRPAVHSPFSTASEEAAAGQQEATPAPPQPQQQQRQPSPPQQQPPQPQSLLGRWLPHRLQHAQPAAGSTAPASEPILMQAVQRGEGTAAPPDSPADGAARVVVRSVSRGSISRPSLGRPSLGRSSLGLAAVSRRQVSRTVSDRRMAPPVEEASPAGIAEAMDSGRSSPPQPSPCPYAAFADPAPPPASGNLAEQPAMVQPQSQPQPSPTASPAKRRSSAPQGGAAAQQQREPQSPERQASQQADATSALLASAAAYKASRSATPER